ncbi:hypothetical protein TCAL_01912 [Tigriopus californicus]|uniref:EGF-like domain-containing protein n=1 Tax=Tigriopus californicus TaxID=6832 RepID=A0A553P6K2_TIGCA|nr:low-density lipoprotein receptor-related protein 6-like [Tigriopus californicus]TRY73318.1 hypothetical protein TCAL_01912 [Tigriopus californicus]
MVLDWPRGRRRRPPNGLVYWSSLLGLALLMGGLWPSVKAIPYLIYANQTDIRLIEVNNRRIETKPNVIVKHLGSVATLDYILRDNLICWSEVPNHWIQCAEIDKDKKGNVEKILIAETSLIAPEGLACDWINNNIYWADSETKRIEVASLQKSERSRLRKVIIWDDIDLPRALAIAPQEGYLFWSDWGSYPKIERVSLDGAPQSRVALVDQHIIWPNGITLDLDNRLLYWVDAFYNQLSVITWDGHDRRNIVSDRLALPHPFSVTFFEETLFWTDWNITSLQLLNLTHFSPEVTSVKPERHGRHGRFRKPTDVKVFQPSRQPDQSAPCRINNGGCSHLCLGSSVNEAKYTCVCPSGIQATSNGTCLDQPYEILILAKQDGLRSISLDTPDFTDIVIPIQVPMPLDREVIAVDFDPVSQFVYFTNTHDTHDSAVGIYRTALDGSSYSEVITSGIRHPDGVAIDWIGNNVFWTDNNKDQQAYVGVARLDGSSKRSIIWHGLDQPRAIALDSSKGWLFWSDWGKSPGIHRAYMDGSNREAVITKQIEWPNGIALDIPEQKLYWCDARKDVIEVSNYDGTNRRVILEDSVVQPFGLTLLGDNLYWTDWQENAVERANKLTGENRTVMVAHLEDLMGVRASRTSAEPWTNECSVNNGGCTHLCLFTPEGKRCQCPNNFELDENLLKCIVPEAFLLYTRGKIIGRLGMTPNNLNDLFIPIGHVRDACALDFDYSQETIYWTDINQKTISRSWLNGSNPEVIFEFDLEYPYGMAVDWISKNIFWTDMGLNRIEVARSNGTSRRILVWRNLNKPASIALNPVEGKMYWSSWGGNNPVIEEANMDGSQRKVFQKQVGKVNGLTVDFQTQRLYWTDLDQKTISYAFVKAPQEVKAVISGLGTPYALTLFNNYLYWADWESNSVETADKDTGKGREIIQSGRENITDILVYQASKQMGRNPCSVGNGGCDYLCFPVAGIAKCDCPSHFVLQPNGRSCAAPDDFLLFGQINKISRWVDELIKNDALRSMIPISGARSISSLSFDPVSRLIYWIDLGSKKRGRISIKRGFENGTLFDRRLRADKDDLFKPYDLAIDPIARVFYWTCEDTNSINITKMDSSRESSFGLVPISTHDIPRSISVHYLRNYLFWVNVGQNHSRIERSSTISQNRVTLFSNLSAPRDLTVDMSEDLLFWADSELKVIERSRIDGGDRKIIVTRRVGTLVGMSVLHNYVYWADVENNAIMRANKHTGQDPEVTISDIKHLSSLFAFQKVLDVSDHPCLHAKCSHLCSLDHLRRPKCHCTQSSGLVLNADDRTCGKPPICKSGDFTCETGACIPLQWRCDGPAECSDHSDEINCPECDPGNFRCRNGECIQSNLICDNKSDCKDSSDEVNCCREHEFRCFQNMMCINQSLLCNGVNDCPDATDELAPRCNTDNLALGIESTSTNTAFYIIPIIVSIIVCLLVLVFVYRKKASEKANTSLESDDRQSRNGHNPTIMDPNNHRFISTESLQNEGRLTPLGMRAVSLIDPSPLAAVGIPPSHVGGSSNGLLYDRSHVTGASSSTASSAGFPNECYGPPPSPTTTVPRNSSVSSRNPLSSVHHHGHQRSTHSLSRRSRGPDSAYNFYSQQRRKPHYPPRPTPCSTDNNDESDATAIYVSHQQVPQRPLYCSAANSTVGYDSESYDPHMESYYPSNGEGMFEQEDLPCPDSPSQERTFFLKSLPEPPPPSRVPSPTPQDSPSDYP